MRGTRILVLAVATVVLAACGGSNDDGDASPPADTETTAEEAESTTSEEQSTTTDATTTTAPDPLEALLEEFNPLYSDGDPAGLDLLAPGSAAHTYYEGLTILSANEPPSPSRVEDGEIRTQDGVTLSDFAVDDAGLITDMSRNGVPLSRSVARLDATFEGIDEGTGVTGRVHSARHFDGNLQLIVTSENQSNDEGYLSLNDYVSEGRQITQVFADPARPGATVTQLVIFEDAPTAGGVVYGAIVSGNISVLEIELPIPPLG